MKLTPIKLTSQTQPAGLSFDPNANGGRSEIARVDRMVTLLMLGRLGRRGSDTICRIRNVSSGGMGIETISPLEKGERIAIEARSGVCLEGHVAWTNDLSAGIAFAGQVDQEILLSAPVGPSGARLIARSPRFAASASARLDIDGCPTEVHLVNISLGGCRVAADFSIPRHAEVFLTLPGMAPLACSSRSSTDNNVGLVFANKIQFASFAQWLESPELRFGVAPASGIGAPDISASLG
ncbi:PilZ domain-containing protein [Pseudoblastomonas halimionae]|uniref:PilZ domain-containing protein n=1 Tax=Alteriqipengyuania halimionae TaxID=1926630 RepID=A0A6I4U521_9SPHN|nr:PilZ domain-containing protein [Alteriqipengyuania halimionae]MXP10454.1 hypothetical protein [Alteriqipengyuania halimionae]